MVMNSFLSELKNNNVIHVDISSRIMFDTLPEHVFYMSYGSNLAMERFMCYIEGGTPVGSKRNLLGCRDVTAPIDSFGVSFSGQPYFAGVSTQWGGGGFLFTDFGVENLGLGRVHLVTREQFEDVVAQECGMPVGSMDIDFTTLLRDSVVDNTGLLYGRMFYVGTVNNIPVVSFTTCNSLENVRDGAVGELMLNAPSDGYANMVSKGLKESFNFTDEMVFEYLNTIVGY